MKKPMMSALLFAVGLFTFSAAQAYTMQDYNEADEAVVQAQQQFEAASDAANYSLYLDAINQAYAAFRTQVENCGKQYPNSESSREDCQDTAVNDEYYAEEAANQAYAQAQTDLMVAQNNLTSAQSHFAEVRDDLVKQGLLSA